jgi:hypothetical protein
MVTKDAVEAGLEFGTTTLLEANSATLRTSRPISRQGVAGREVSADAATFSMRVHSYVHTDGDLSLIVMGPKDRLATPGPRASTRP